MKEMQRYDFRIAMTKSMRASLFKSLFPVDAAQTQLPPRTGGAVAMLLRPHGGVLWTAH